MRPRPAVHHPVVARLLVPTLEAADRAGFARWRDELVAGLRGRVVEVGAGADANVDRYPDGVELVAVEPEPHLRAAAERAAAGRVGGRPVEVVDAVAEDLPLPDGAFDAAVACLVLCSVADAAVAAAELRRVVRPGGELRFLEHVQAPPGALRRAQRVLDVAWPRLAGGCHLSRDAVATIESAGFVVDRLERFTFRACVLGAPVGPHVLGVARRP